MKRIIKLNKLENTFELGDIGYLDGNSNSSLKVKSFNGSYVPISAGDGIDLNDVATLRQLYNYGSPSIAFYINSRNYIPSIDGTIGIATETFNVLSNNYKLGHIYYWNNNEWGEKNMTDAMIFVAAVNLLDSHNNVIYKENHIYVYDITTDLWYDSGDISSNNSLIIGHYTLNGSSDSFIKHFDRLVANTYINRIECRVITPFNGTPTLQIIANNNITLLNTEGVNPDVDLKDINKENQIVDCYNYCVSNLDDVQLIWNKNDCTEGIIEIYTFYYKNLVEF